MTDTITPSISERHLQPLVSSPSGARTPEVMERELEQIFARVPKPRKTFDDVTFEFTRDPALLEQYYTLRKYMYLNKWKLWDYVRDGETEHDRVGKILVARSGNRVVGGVRIIIKTPRSAHNLTLEDDGIDIRKLLPEYKLDYVPYAEFSCLARAPDFRGSAFLLKYHETARRKALAYGAKYFFFISTVQHAKAYRMLFANHRDKCKTLMEFPNLDRFEGTKMMLSVIELDAQSSTEDLVLADISATESVLVTGNL